MKKTNLKEKQAVIETQSKNIPEISSLTGSIDCEGPNEYLESWNGAMTLDQDIDANVHVLNVKNLLLRGSIIRNTEWVLGITVYCGHNTKIFKNLRKPPSKISHVLKIMNKILYTVFLFQSLLCISFAMGSVIWEKDNTKNMFYLEKDGVIGLGDYIERIFVFLVAYSQLIPISLYVALEVLKLFLSYFISNDENMNYKQIQKKAKVKTSDLVEELGQIGFLFSDKTGTLTCNEMKFRMCLIGNKVYGNQKLSERKELKYHLNNDTSLYEEIVKEGPNSNNISEFFRLISLCHTVVPDFKDADRSSLNDQIKYQASSPDELALVEGAKSMGFMFTNRSTNKIEIKIFNRLVEEWIVFLEFPFDSTRKRMSLIVKAPNSGHYMLLTKGADSVMLPRIKGTNEMVASLKNQLDSFAKEGLRTLVMGQRPISKREFEKIEKEITKIKAENHKHKDRYLSDIFDLIESKLTFVGCSAIEDKLQDEVPRTISICMEAGIRVWVLTGDKQETAIEIGKSCKLIKEEMEIIILSSINKDDFYSKLQLANSSYNKEKKVVKPKKLNKEKEIALVIDGSTLLFALDKSNPSITETFFSLGMRASSCICCRVSPKQKADVVALAKSKGKFITAAIGDGANDVSMIMEAHIGIGIFGKEGTQAARSADFAIAQFRFLQHLILVHGRWNYRRISGFIYFYFYKNCVMVFSEIFFAIMSGFSGQIYYIEWLPLLFNAFWTSWPCMANFGLEQVLLL